MSAALESPHVCRMRAAWQGLEAWRVLEVCANSADHFLGIWSAWRADPHRCRMLHYVLIAADHRVLADATRPLPHPHAALAAELAEQSWGLLSGMQRLTFDAGHVLLTVCVGEPDSFLRRETWAFDTVFWNPRSDPIQLAGSVQTLKALSRCCAQGALLVGSGAAVPFAKALNEHGFTTAEPGGSNKPRGDTWSCRYAPAWPKRKTRQTPVKKSGANKRCIVIGAGLSGAAVAASLARRGWQVTVLDAAHAPAIGASGLPVGLFVPNLSADDNPIARISRAGVRATMAECARSLQVDVDWLPGGVLERRSPSKLGLPSNQDSPEDPIRTPGADWARAASAEITGAAGLTPSSAAVQHQRAGWIKPATLVQALLSTPGVRFQAHAVVTRLERCPVQTGQPNADAHWCAFDADGALLGEAELAVVACGPHSNALLTSAGLDALPLTAIRGQLSWGMQDDDAAALPAQPVNGKGALIPHIPVDGGLAWHVGSTFERGQTDLPVQANAQAAAHAANFDHLKDLLPRAAQALAPTFAGGAPALKHWAGVRCTVPDRLPLVGPVAPVTHTGLWLCTGMGARGLSRAVLCGELLAARLHAEPLPLETLLAAAMAADRFTTNGREPAHPTRTALPTPQNKLI